MTDLYKCLSTQGETAYLEWISLFEEKNGGNKLGYAAFAAYPSCEEEGGMRRVYA